MKQVSKEQNPAILEYVREEIKIFQKCLYAKRIVDLVDVFEDSKKIVYVIEDRGKITLRQFLHKESRLERTQVL